MKSSKKEKPIRKTPKDKTQIWTRTHPLARNPYLWATVIVFAIITFAVLLASTVNLSSIGENRQVTGEVVDKYEKDANYTIVADADGKRYHLSVSEGQYNGILIGDKVEFRLKDRTITDVDRGNGCVSIILMGGILIGAVRFAQTTRYREHLIDGEPVNCTFCGDTESVLVGGGKNARNSGSEKEFWFNFRCRDNDHLFTVYTDKDLRDEVKR